MIWLLWFACAYDEATFAEKYQTAWCDWASDCGYFESADACVAASDASDPPSYDGCTYAGAEAYACVDALEVLACPEGGAFPERPVACDAVYACP
jgi:hypothetical protein